MKREVLYERRASASRMEAVMLGVAGVCVFAAVIAFLSVGWMPSVGFLVLGSLAFGLARIFELLGELFASTGTTDRRTPVPARPD